MIDSFANGSKNQAELLHAETTVFRLVRAIALGSGSAVAQKPECLKVGSLWIAALRKMAGQDRRVWRKPYPRL